MIREVIATGKTVDAAIDLGCEKLGIDRNETDFEVEIIDMQSKGFLGIGAKPAKVRVYIETPDPVVVPEKKAENYKSVFDGIQKKLQKAGVSNTYAYRQFFLDPERLK